MKKIISLITALMLSAALLAGCGSSDGGSADQNETQENSGAQAQAEPADVNVMALKGPTAMGMVKLMDDADSGNVDTENYNLRDDTWFTDYKSDQRWGRRSNVLNLGRNLGSIAMKYGDVARALSQDVGGLFNRATASLSMALGYYGTRFDTYMPSTYLGTAGNASNIMNVGTGNTANNAASGGF